MKIVVDSQLTPLLRRWIPDGISLTETFDRNADALLVRSVTRVDRALLENTAIRFVATASAGHDHLDKKALDKLGISWSASQGCNAVSVAEYVLSCLAAASRAGLLPQRPLRMAIVGVGHVGKAVFELCHHICSAVYCIDPPRNLLDWEQIPEVDVVSLHTPLTYDGEHPTFHLLNRERMLKLKAGTLVISAGRGAVVDTACALQSGRHLTWCLDVYEGEPVISREFVQQAFIATPHIAGHAIQAKWRAVRMAAESIAQFGGFELKSDPITPEPDEVLDLRDIERWEELVLRITDPLPLTAQLKENPKDFTTLRLAYPPRHEFAWLDKSGLLIDKLLGIRYKARLI